MCILEGESGGTGSKGWKVLEDRSQQGLGFSEKGFVSSLCLICWAKPGRVCPISGNSEKMPEKRFPSHFSVTREKCDLRAHVYNFPKAWAVGCQAGLWP